MSKSEKGVKLNYGQTKLRAYKWLYQTEELLFSLAEESEPCVYRTAPEPDPEIPVLIRELKELKKKILRSVTDE